MEPATVVHRLDGLGPEERRRLALRLLDVANDAFRMEVAPLHAIHASLEESHQLATWIGVDGSELGFTFAQRLVDGHDGWDMVWVDKIAIRSGLQAQGIGKGRVASVAGAAPWLGCTTQNPSMVRLFAPIRVTSGCYAKAEGVVEITSGLAETV